MVAVRSFELSLSTPGTGRGGVSCTVGDISTQLLIGSDGWRLTVQLRGAADVQALRDDLARGRACLVVGDGDEVAAGAPPYVNALLAHVDVASGTVTLATSLTGLPPLFRLHRNQGDALSSPFLPQSARGSLAPDPEGIADTLRWGHPIDGRTLFADLAIVPASAGFTVDASGKAAQSAPAQWPDTGEFAAFSREELVREQVDAFTRAASRFTTTSAFVSLSGGLDSRTSLVSMLVHGHRPPCVTMAGSPDNLDARLAEEICRAYRLEHTTVMLDDSFVRAAPDLLARTASLTGGVSALSQTADLFLYDSLGDRFTTRISGNLGNQVGRGGVESLSAYRPEPQVFATRIRQCLAARPLVPWFIERLAQGDYGAVLFGQEVQFWSIPNYVVGSSRALQFTPYADRRLLYLARAAFTRDRQLQPPTWKGLRTRDLRHRLRGTPRALSFQRQFLARHGGAGVPVPLNWGWRAAGGWSARWGAAAMASAADAAMTKYGARPGLARPLAKWLGTRLKHRSALVNWPLLVRTRLRDLAGDVFASASVRQAGVFELAALDRMLADHFSGEADHHATVARSLEIALGVLSRARGG